MRIEIVVIINSFISKCAIIGTFFYQYHILKF